MEFVVSTLNMTVEKHFGRILKTISKKFLEQESVKFFLQNG